jgi:CheY-like chemotaxis protein
MIDDEPDIREVAQTGLEVIGGWEVSTAGCGSDGLARAAAERPDAILLDMMMPEMDGSEVFRRLRADETTRSIPVVFLTAKVQAADQRFLRELGAEGMIAKPFDPLLLADEISRVLGWSS